MNLEKELAQARAEDMADGLTEPGQLLTEGAEGAAPMPEVQAGPDYQREAAGVVHMGTAFICSLAPKAKDIWDDQTKAAVTLELGNTMEYFGFTVGNAPPWVMLLFVAGPPIWNSAPIIAEAIEEKRAKAIKKQADSKPKETGPMVSRPGATPEVPEVARHSQMGLYQ